jgi:rod shape determining protein RodA
VRRLAVAAGALAIAAPVALIAVQPDLGTGIVVGLIILSVCFLVLDRVWPLALVCAACAGMAPILWSHMRDYQKNRVLAFLDPAADPTGIGWHTQQSIFAVGSGRLTGKGFLGATQNHFNFLPEYWTDFPFSVWAEEWGFVGSVAVIAIYAFLVLWIAHVATRARDAFGVAICLGVGAMIFWHVTVNIAMVLGAAPVVGLTLPLVSYGGSSVVAVLIGLGLVSSVSMRRR